MKTEPLPFKSVAAPLLSDLLVLQEDLSKLISTTATYGTTECRLWNDADAAEGFDIMIKKIQRTKNLWFPDIRIE